MHNIFTRLIFSLAVTLLLQACVLQSKTPLFAEKDGEMLLNDYGSTFVSYSMNKGEWEKEKDAVTFAATGQHYVVKSEKSENDVLFVRLGGTWLLMQVGEADKDYAYVLVDARQKELLIHPLSCEILKKFERLPEQVSFEGDDCTAGTGMDRMKVVVLAGQMGKAEMKLVPDK